MGSRYFTGLAHKFVLELFQVVNRKNNGYGTPADIWSLGCTVLEMLTGQIPYSHLEGVFYISKIEFSLWKLQHLVL